MASFFILKNAEMSNSKLRWTKNFIINENLHVAQKYTIKEIDGKISFY